MRLQSSRSTTATNDASTGRWLARLEFRLLALGMMLTLLPVPSGQAAGLLLDVDHPIAISTETIRGVYKHQPLNGLRIEDIRHIRRGDLRQAIVKLSWHCKARRRKIYSTVSYSLIHNGNVRRLFELTYHDTYKKRDHKAMMLRIRDRLNERLAIGDKGYFPLDALPDFGSMCEFGITDEDVVEPNRQATSDE